MSKKEKYYGILLNNDIPKLNKKNKYNKKVKVSFEGEANLIERNDDGEIIKRTRLENKTELKKEDDYEIEFTNCRNEEYYLQVRLETSYLFLIIILFLVGIFIFLLFYKPVNSEISTLKKFYDYINMAVLKLDIAGKEEIQEFEGEKTQNETEKKYEFDITHDNISSNDIKLTDSISAETFAKSKIAPRSKWKFFDNNQRSKKLKRYEI